MKVFQRVLLLLALLFGCVHLLWFCHHKWVRPRTSVLDKYEEPLAGVIREARSLGELESRYKEAVRTVDLYEANPNSPKVEEGDRGVTEPYRTRETLKRAIRDWEEKDGEIGKTRFFWIAGLLFTVLGTVVYRRWNAWLGLSFLVVGFSEMLFWCSPGYLEGASYQFDRMLANNLFLCVLTLLALAAVTPLTGTLEREKAAPPK